MKVFLHELVEDKFTNSDTGEIIEYSNALIYDDEHNNSDTRKGRRITKVRTSPGLILTVNADDVPGWFDAEIGIASAGRLKLTKLTPIKSEKK